METDVVDLLLVAVLFGLLGGLAGWSLHAGVTDQGRESRDSAADDTNPMSDLGPGH